MKLTAGQVAVVTGGASGIGFALAEAFAARGLSVVLADVRAEALEQAQAELSADASLTVVCDVSDRASVAALADATIERFGRADVVCNNAGIVPAPAPMWEQDPARWRWLIDVALMGVVHGVQSFVPHMLERGSGHVLNTGSTAGLMPVPNLTPYAAVKHAVVGLTETLDIELRRASPGVGATVLCPGPVKTALHRSSRELRPAEAPASTSGGPGSLDANYGAPISPADVAAMALEGIEHDRIHVLTHRDGNGPIRDSLARVMAALPAQTEDRPRMT